jgi:hypothetical protein
MAFIAAGFCTLGWVKGGEISPQAALPVFSKRVLNLADCGGVGAESR